MIPSLVLASLLAADPEQVYRAGAFEVITRDEAKTARVVLNHLEQFRYAFGATVGQPDAKPLWPVRIRVTAKQTTDLKLGRDAYEATIARNTPVPPQWNRALGEILLRDAVNRMPDRFERGLIDFFSTLEVTGVKVIAGAPPAPVNIDWARVHLLMVNDSYRGRLRPLLFNLQQGNDPAASFKNSLGVTEADIEKQLAEWMKAGSYSTTALNAKPINPERDFYPREWKPPAASPMDAFDRGDFAAAAQLKPDWPEPKRKLAEKEPDPARRSALLEEAAKLARRDASLWREVAESLLAQNRFPDAAKAWGFAERAAATDADRARMRQARLELENTRADFDDNEKRRKKQAADDELNRLRNEELARIKRAEAKANAGLTPLAPGTKVEEWWEDKTEQLAGTLERIDCAAARRILVVRTPDKKLTRIALPADPTRMQLIGAPSMAFDCGPLKAPLSVNVHYAGKAPATLEAVKLEIR